MKNIDSDFCFGYTPMAGSGGSGPSGPARRTMLSSPEWLDSDGPGPNEVRCAGCGCWNHPHDARCDRCGRRLDAAPSAEGRRNAEEADALPGPSEEAPAKPAPEPEWKEELNRRLAGYRERKVQSGEPLESRLPLPELDQPHAVEDRPSALPPPRRSQAVAEAPPLPREKTSRENPLPPIVERVEEEEVPDIGIPPTSASRPMEELLAPLSLRAVAGLMDATVVLVALGIFLAVGRGAAHLLGAVGPNPDVLLLSIAFCALLTFYWIFYFRFFGRTAGMTWIGLRLLNFDSQPPSAEQRRNRVLGVLLSGAALGVGFAWAAADEQRLCWHDRMSKTFVALDDPPA